MKEEQELKQIITDEINKIKEKSIITKKTIKKRRDFRNILTFTIDPASAKDFDDALSFRRLNDNTYEVGVHISDVTFFIKERTCIDKMARKKAMSTYLINECIPMLPEQLCNNICSLNPNEDKLTFSVVFIIDKDAIIKSTWFGKTIINSNRRFTYEQAQDIIDNNTIIENDIYYDALTTLNGLAKILKKKRIEKGSIELDKIEQEYVLDERGLIVEIKDKERIETNDLIEEFMLIANKAVATKLRDDDYPSIYRNHPDLCYENIRRLKNPITYCDENKYEWDEEIIIRNILNKARNSVDSDIIKMFIARSMPKAYYSMSNIGHYGLGFECYTHFTSPIRRYPDMMTHRLLERCLKKKKIKNENTLKRIQKIAENCSIEEIYIQRHERSDEKHAKLRYMWERCHKNDLKDAIITDVQPYGIFVTLMDLKIDGLIRFDYMEHDKHNWYCKCKKDYVFAVTTKDDICLKVGDKIKVAIQDIDLSNNYLNLDLWEVHQ